MLVMEILAAFIQICALQIPLRMQRGGTPFGTPPLYSLLTYGGDVFAFRF